MKSIQLCTVGLLLVATAVSAQQQGSAAKKLYCWNEGGRRVCGDALPASAVDGARTEINSKSGLPGARIDRALTAEERAAQAALQAEAQAKADQAAADVEMKNGKVPAKLAQNVLTQRASVLDAQESYRLQQQERGELDAKLNDALTRYRKAKGLDPVTGQAPAPTLTPIQAPPAG